MAVYSHSRLGTFESCPRQYYYHYVTKIPVEDGPTPVHFVLGTCVHTALEELYKAASGGRVMTPKQLVGVFDQAWKSECGATSPDLPKGETEADHRRIGARILTAYHDQHAPFNGARLIGLEQKVQIDLNGDGRYRLVGYIDRLMQRHDGTYEINDYKTSKHLPTQDELDADRQLALYQIGLGRMWKDTEHVELVWHYLRHEKEMHSSRTPEQLDELKHQTIALIDDIESRGREESRFETCESGLCGWCDYQKVCPVRKHLFKTAEMPANRFLKDSGVKLVNRHEKLTAEIDRLAGEIESLKAERDQVDEALLVYAEREDMKTVVGSTHEASISEKIEIGLPSKGEAPEEYIKLDAKLRRGKSWPEVSTLDPHALRRIWKGEQEDPGNVRKTLKPFVTEEATRTVRVRKRRT